MIALATLKLHLKIDTGVTADDTLITAMETAAVAYIQNETGCYFGPAVAFVEILAAQGWGSIWLQAAPLLLPAPLALERRLTPTGTFAAVDPAEYELDGQRIHPLAWWDPGVRTLRATYTAGYAALAEPPDVRQAVMELVTRMYEYRLPIVAGGMMELPFSVRDVIRARKLMVVG